MSRTFRLLCFGLLLLSLSTTTSACFSFRTAVGGSVDIEPNPPARKGEPAPTMQTRAGVAVDVGVGFNMPLLWFTRSRLNRKSLRRPSWLEKRLMFMPEIGYSFDSSFFPAKVTFGLGGGLFLPNLAEYFILDHASVVAYIPSFVMAFDQGPNLHLGMRNAIRYYFWTGLYVEAQYEFLFNEGRTRHDVRVLLGMDWALSLGRSLAKSVFRGIKSQLSGQ